jgi:glucosyl-3-phosphoglycerate phosphatase
VTAPRGRRVVLWRHGQTSWNVEGRFQGHADIPLTEVGLAQARAAAARLATLRPAAIVSSDLSRARSTAAELARFTGLDVTTDSRLRERSGGVWEGLTQDEIRARYPEEWAAWRPTDGEDDLVAGKRVAEAVLGAVESLGAGELLVVAGHGGSLRYGIGVLLDLDPTQWHRLGPLSNCAWSVLDETPKEWRYQGWRLLEHNAGSLPEPALSDDR